MSYHLRDTALHKDQAHPLPLAELSRFDWLVGGLLVATFLASRLINVMALPIFVDEGIHISWAQNMLETGDFLHGTAAGKFLHIWILALIIPWAQNPLAAARALSVAIGLASTISTVFLGHTLWPYRRSGWITILVYLFLPLPLITERMALVDNLLTVLATLILILSLKFIRQPRKLTGYALGICLGLAYLTKLSGLIYFAIPILAFFLLRDRERTAKVLIRPYSVALLVTLPSALDSPRQFFNEAVRSVLNPIGSQIPASDWRLYGLGETWLDLSTYVTWPILLLAAIRLFRGLQSRERETLLIGLLLLLTPTIYILLAKDIWYSRYLLPMIPLLVVLASRTLVDLATLLAQSTRVSSQYLGVRAGLAPAQAGNRKGLPLLFEKIRTRLGHKKVWLASLSLLALLPSLVFDYQLITDPRYTSLTPVDRWQYITGWPSGYGLTETVTWLRQEAAAKGPLVVITDIHSGPTQEGIRLYLGNGETELRLLSADLRGNSGGEMLQQLVQAQTLPTLLLLNEPADKDLDAPTSPCPTVLAAFPKPDNHSRLVLKGCEPSSQ